MDTMQQAARAGGARQAPEWLDLIVRDLELAMDSIDRQAIAAWGGPVPIDTALHYLEAVSAMRRHLDAARRAGQEAALWIEGAKQ